MPYAPIDGEHLLCAIVGHNHKADCYTSKGRFYDDVLTIVWPFAGFLFEDARIFRQAVGMSVLHHYETKITRIQKSRDVLLSKTDMTEEQWAEVIKQVMDAKSEAILAVQCLPDLRLPLPQEVPHLRNMPRALKEFHEACCGVIMKADGLHIDQCGLCSDCIAYLDTIDAAHRKAYGEFRDETHEIKRAIKLGALDEMPYLTSMLRLIKTLRDTWNLARLFFDRFVDVGPADWSESYYDELGVKAPAFVEGFGEEHDYEDHFFYGKDRVELICAKEQLHGHRHDERHCYTSSHAIAQSVNELDRLTEKYRSIGIHAPAFLKLVTSNCDAASMKADDLRRHSDSTLESNRGRKHFLQLLAKHLEEKIRWTREQLTLPNTYMYVGCGLNGTPSRKPGMLALLEESTKADDSGIRQIARSVHSYLDHASLVLRNDHDCDVSSDAHRDEDCEKCDTLVRSLDDTYRQVYLETKVFLDTRATEAQQQIVRRLLWILHVVWDDARGWFGQYANAEEESDMNSTDYDPALDPHSYFGLDEYEKDLEKQDRSKQAQLQAGPSQISAKMEVCHDDQRIVEEKMEAMDLDD